MRSLYIAAGANRHPAAADWVAGALAFGSGWNIAVWDMTVRYFALFGPIFLVREGRIMAGPLDRFGILSIGYANLLMLCLLGNYPAVSLCVSDSDGRVPR